MCLRPSVLWCCWLDGRKSIQLVKNWALGVGMVICLERGADLYMDQLMPLPLTVSCFSKIQIGFTFLVPAHLGRPGKRAVKWVCVCVCPRPSLLWCCWLGGRKGIRLVKNWVVVGIVISLQRDADFHTAQLMPLPLTVSCFSKIQIGFTFLVPGHTGSPGKRAVKRVSVWPRPVHTKGHRFPKLRSEFALDAIPDLTCNSKWFSGIKNRNEI